MSQRDGSMIMDQRQRLLDTDTDTATSDDEEVSTEDEDIDTERQSAGLHSYLGEIDDVSYRSTILDGGTCIVIPLLCLEGIVLFPGATLPLRILQPRLKAAVEAAMENSQAPGTLGVVHVFPRRYQDRGISLASVGTTAKIKQSRLLVDGSVNIVAKGCQRFRLADTSSNADGVLFGVAHIIAEEPVLSIPKDAFGLTAAIPNFQSCKDTPEKIEDISEEGMKTMKMHKCHTEDPDVHAKTDASKESWWTAIRWKESFQRSKDGPDNEQRINLDDENSSVSSRSDNNLLSTRHRWVLNEAKWLLRPQRSAWPHWVYRMFDAYGLARRAADLWKQSVELPSNIYNMTRTPEMLSFHIASKMPVQDSTRQELLEIDSVVYRLQREIRLLESFNHVNCKTCMTLIARRSDIIMVSAEGPIDAFVNNFGIVHETLTLRHAEGLSLEGDPETQHSWFPGYSWTIAYCNQCSSHMGWLFKAVKKGKHPKQFWGLRRSQLVEGCGGE